jgi:Tfp pilus assembly protein PilO
MPRIFITIICFLITLLLGVGLILPKYQDFKAVQKNINQKSLEVKYKKEYFSQLQKTSEELKNYTDALDKIDSALPLSPNLPTLFEFLQKSSSENGLILKKIKMGSTTPLQGFQEVQETNVSLSLSGSYSAFKNFLTTLQKTSRLIEIVSINFSSPTKGDIFSFDLDIKVHSY